MHQKEIQIVRFSMLALFSALMIVYLLLYEIKGAQISKELSQGITTGQMLSSQDDFDAINHLYSGEQDQYIENEEEPKSTSSGIVIKSTQSLFSSLTGVNKTGGVNKIGNTSTGSKTLVNTIKILSGTSLYYGTVESAEKLGINYQYALKDQKGILYVYLGTGKYDIETITRQLGGTMYKMTTEQEITQNKLFGDTVIYINLPEYKDKKVIMMITINKSIWLLQVDYATYHKSKSYIKKIFTE